MSNSHRVPYDLNNADLTLEDPGNGGTIYLFPKQTDFGPVAAT